MPHSQPDPVSLQLIHIRRYRPQVNHPVKAAAGKAGMLAELKGCAFTPHVIGIFHFLSSSVFFQGSEQFAL
jgi:hypothetical protein